MSEQGIQRSHNQFYMVCTWQKDHLLSNEANKQTPFKKGTNIGKQEFRVLPCDGDTDLMIMLTAVEAANIQVTVIVGEDTDLLELLCHHANMESYRIFFKSQPKKVVESNPKVWS